MISPRNAPPYRIRATKSEPEIDFSFDDDTLSITGPCWMVDAYKFFAPHIEWLDRFLAGGKEPVTFVFGLTRANSSSKPHIQTIVKLLKKNSSPERKIEVEWRSHPFDRSIGELGRHIKDLVERDGEDGGFSFEIKSSASS